MTTPVQRRDLLRRSFIQLGLMTSATSFLRCDCRPNRQTTAPGTEPLFAPWHPPEISVPTESNFPNLGPLQAPDELGLRLPRGFRARIVARSGESVSGSRYRWHDAPDGGATFLTNDGGYVYVSNSEVWLRGGAGALRFDREGNLTDAYPILEGTEFNCAGGATPWGTWLSCEERDRGQVWECDPFGKVGAVARPSLGLFSHEAVAVDLDTLVLYLTEDQVDGRLYRFIPDNNVGDRPDLRAGTLQSMQVMNGTEGPVEWIDVPDPSGSDQPTRYQVAESTPFNGGEGIAFRDGVIYFTTKGDNRVWAYDTRASDLVMIYDDDRSSNPILQGVDNLIVTSAGDLLVAEDGGDMQIVAITEDRLLPVLQLAGQPASEITGPALDPYRKRLYFSSQRGFSGSPFGSGGITYEVSGPFFAEG